MTGQEIRDAVLDAIYQLESSSGTNKAAYKINEEGKLGGYQFGKPEYDEAVAYAARHGDTKWQDISFQQAAKDDDLAREVASYILDVKGQSLSSLGVVSTPLARAVAYHSGEGNLSRDTLGPVGKAYSESIQEALDRIGYKGL